MYYIIGDIHGHYNRLVKLFDSLSGRITGEDTLLFLGDYIDRGPQSFEVIDFLVHLSRGATCRTVFLKGNHEDMFEQYRAGKDDAGMFTFNGGDATIRSYHAHRGRLDLPQHHLDFFGGLRLYYEGEDFIAVHAGLNPRVGILEAQSERDLLWIRDAFFRAGRRWDKTVIFGHTPVTLMKSEGPVFFDNERNIIGIDSGVIFGRPLVCLVWPRREIITG